MHGGTCFADDTVGAAKARLTPTRYVFRGFQAFRFWIIRASSNAHAKYYALIGPLIVAHPPAMDGEYRQGGAIRASSGSRAAIFKSHAKASRITAVAVRLRHILHCPLA